MKYEKLANLGEIKAIDYGEESVGTGGKLFFFQLTRNKVFLNFKITFNTLQDSFYLRVYSGQQKEKRTILDKRSMKICSYRKYGFGSNVLIDLCLDR